MSGLIFIGPDDVFTVSFYASETGQLQSAHLTHANFTAGVAAIRDLLPVSDDKPPLDAIVSAHSLSTSFGRAVAYTAVFEGASFATLDSTKLFHMEDGEYPTILFINYHSTPFSKTRK
jgi:long-chain acyl-CoA synthetase